MATTADIIIALTQDALNTASESIYNAARPKFTGSIPYTSANPPIDLTVHWDVTAAPIVDLTPSPAAQAAVAAYFQGVTQTNPSPGIDPQAAGDSLSASLPNCSVSLPQIVLIIRAAGQPDATLNLDHLNAYCYIAVAQGTVTLTPLNLTADHDPDPLRDLLIQKVLLPVLQQLLASHLNGIAIPSLAVEGVQLSPPSLAITDSHIVAAANLAAKGSPSPSTGVNWTPANYSALVSQDTLQAAVAYGLTQVQSSLRDSGQQEQLGFGYYWGYICTPGSPRVALVNGTDVSVTLPLTASVWGGGIVAGLQIGVDYAAHVSPDPEFICSATVVGNQVHFTVATVNQVVITLQPQGNVGQLIAGWMLDGIVNAITASVSVIFTTFVRTIPIPPLTIPILTPTVAGITFTVAPNNLSLSDVNGMLAVGGDLAVSAAP